MARACRGSSPCSSRSSASSWPKTRWSRTCCSSTACIPLPLEAAGGKGARPCPSVPRFARRRRRPPRARGRRRPVVAEGQLQRLCVVGCDARVGDREGVRRGGALICSALEVEGAVDKVRSPVQAPAAGRLGRDRERFPSRAASVSGVPGLFVANVAGTLLAYRDACAGCGAARCSAAISTTARSNALRAAVSTHCRSPGGVSAREDLQLVPVPLLEADGRVRVAR